MLKLAIKGMRGRKKQTWLTLVILTMVVIVVMASALYSYSSSIGDLQRKKETYGSWQFAYYEETKERVELLKTNSELEVGVGTQLGKIVGSNHIGDTKIVVGELGSLDQGYLDLGNLKLLSGSFPQKDNEIALTSSLLDSLGYSYQLGQTIKINLLANDDLNNTGKIQEYEFTLSGVLFSYDIFWQKGSNNIINAVVAENTYVKADAKVYQILTYQQNIAQKELVANVNIPTKVFNDNVYSKDDQFTKSLLVSLSLALMIALLTIITFFIFTFRKRKRSVKLLRELGASSGTIISLNFWEALLSTLIAEGFGIILSYLIIIGFSLISKQTFYSLSISLILVLVGSTFLVIFLAYLSSLFLVIRKLDVVTAKNYQRYKKFKLSLPLGWGTWLIYGLIVLVALSCLYGVKIAMLGYDMNKKYTVVNADYRGLENNTWNANFINTLSSLPDVEKISAQYDDSLQIYTETNKFYLSSDFIQQDGMYKYYRSGIDSNTENMPYKFDDKNNLAITVLVLSDLDLEDFAKQNKLSNSEISQLIEGEGTIYYSAKIYTNDQGKYAYGKVSGSTNIPSDWHLINLETLSKNEAGLIIPNKYILNGETNTSDSSNPYSINILQTYSTVSSDTQFLRSNVLYPSTLIVSQSFYKKLMEEYYHLDLSEGVYNRLNLMLRNETPYAVRSSISYYITSHSGYVNADAYEKVEQMYLQGRNNSFNLLLLGFAIMAVALIILVDLIQTKIEELKYRIGIYQILGISSRKLLRTRLKGILIPLLIIPLGLDFLVILIAKKILTKGYIVKLIVTMMATDKVGKIDYPYITQIIISLVLIILVGLLAYLPVRNILKKEPVENIERRG